MKHWVRRLLGILAVGGGVTGLTAVFAFVFTDTSLASRILMLLFAPLHAWGIWCGVQMFEGHPNATRNNLRFWIVQIPILYSSGLSYLFSTGVMAGIWLQFSPLKLNFLLWAGARSEATFNQPNPFAIGVNVFAVVISVFLWRILRREAATDPGTHAAVAVEAD